MEIRYSKHPLVRLEMRGISHGLSRIVYERARRRFFDTASGLEIALLRTAYLGKQREVAVAYRVYPLYVLLVTIHPLKQNQRENRIQSGRWKEIV